MLFFVGRDIEAHTALNREIAQCEAPLNVDPEVGAVQGAIIADRRRIVYGRRDVVWPLPCRKFWVAGTSCLCGVFGAFFNLLGDNLSKMDRIRSGCEQN